MAALGELPPLDAAIHADTRHERQDTYTLARQYTPWLQEHGIHVITVTATNTNPRQGRMILIPAHTPTGMLKRQCTAYWKIYPIRKAIHTLLAPHIHATHNELWMGISTDEAHRMKASNVRYLTNTYPLISLRMSRDDCKRWLTNHGLPVPVRSACTFCPYQSTGQWNDVLTSPPDRAAAVAADELLRTHRTQVFAHRTRRPLANVTPQPAPPQQLDLWQDECTGLCNA
jgi:hypothetical protein